MIAYTNALSLPDLFLHQWVGRQSLIKAIGLPEVEVSEKARLLNQTIVESDWLIFDDLSRVKTMEGVREFLETLFGAAVEEARRVLGEEGHCEVIQATAEWVNAADKATNPFLDRGFFRLRIITNPKA